MVTDPVSAAARSTPDGGYQRLPLTSTVSSQAALAGLTPTPVLNPTLRADRPQVARAARSGSLLDVRTPQEYTGQWLSEPEFPGESAHRPGHIPVAVNIP